MQPAQHKKTNRNKKSSSIVWLTAALLTILVIATVAAAGNCLYRYAHRSDCQISLYDGRQAEEVFGELKQTSNFLKDGKASVLQSESTQYVGSKAQEQAQQNAFEVDDNEQVWETETAIELFSAEYKNADGVTTVKSADGSKVVAPGTGGSYTFSLKNTSDSNARYRVWVEAELNATATGAPIETRMVSDKGWLLGDRNSWEQADVLDGVTTEENIDAGRSAEYTIYWQWPFEQGNDTFDTGLSDVSVKQDLSYTVTIHTMTVTATDSDQQNEQKPVKRLLEAVKTGDNAPIFLWLIALMTAAGVILYLGIIKRRKNDREHEHDEYRQRS